MRKIFKKVVTAVASLAMMAGLVAGMPTMEAKAATACGGEKKIYVSVPTNVEYVGMNIWHGLSTSAAAGSGSYGYCKMMTKVQDGLFVIKGTMYDDFNKNASSNPSWDGIDVLLINDAEGTGDSGKYTCKGGERTEAQSANFSAITDALLSTTATEVWLEIVSDGYTIKVGSPVTITATDEEIAQEVVAKINAALALSATKENKATYDAAKTAYDGLTDTQKAFVPADKLASLNAGIAAIQAAIDAENAAASGKLTIYVKNSENWSAMKLYSWKDSTKFFGDWPGKDMTACTKNEGWYSAQFDITAATSLIFNNGENGEGGKQTKDIKDVSAGTYWFTLALNENNQLVATASTTAPQGWVDEAAAEIKPVTPGDTNNTNNNTNNATTPSTGDATPVAAAVAAVVLMGLAVVVLNTKKANR